MSIEGQGHFLTIYFQVLYALCFTRYQVSVYRTNGPLVIIGIKYSCILAYFLLFVTEPYVLVVSVQYENLLLIKICESTNCLDKHKYIHSASMKSYQYQFRYFGKYKYNSTALFAFMFLVNGRLVWRKIAVSRAPELWCT